MRGVRRFLDSFLFLVIIAALFLRWQISVVKQFDPDELVQLHTSWLITQGRLPYKDFFTGYPPSFSLLIGPFLAFLPPSDFVPIIVRQIFFGLFILNLFLIYKVARLGLDRSFSLLAVLTTAVSVLSLERGVEVRPDNLLIPLWLGSVYLLARAEPRSLFWAGVLAGVAATLTQKSIFGTAFVLLVLAYRLWSRGKIREVVRLARNFLFGFSLPFLVILVYLVRFSLISYIPDFLIKYPMNLSRIYQWDHPWYVLGFVKGFTTFGYFDYLYKFSHLWLRETQVTWIIGVLAVPFWLLVRSKTKTATTPEGRLFVVILLSGLFTFAAYVLTIYVKLPQYYLFLTQFVSLSFAFGLSELARLRPSLTLPILTASLTLLGATTLALWPAWGKDLGSRDNARQRQNIRTVLAETPQVARGYDGAGSYIFRDDCYYFGMVLPGEIPMDIYRDVIEDFTLGKCDFVLWGPHSRMDNWNLNERNYVKANFSPLPSNPDVLIRNRP